MPRVLDGDEGGGAAAATAAAPWHRQRLRLVPGAHPQRALPHSPPVRTAHGSVPPARTQPCPTCTGLRPVAWPTSTRRTHPRVLHVVCVCGRPRVTEPSTVKQTFISRRDSYSWRSTSHQWNTFLTRQHVTTNRFQRKISDCHSSTTGRGRVCAVVRANQRRQCLPSHAPGHAGYSIGGAAEPYVSDPGCARPRLVVRVQLRPPAIRYPPPPPHPGEACLLIADGAALSSVRAADDPLGLTSTSCLLARPARTALVPSACVPRLPTSPGHLSPCSHSCVYHSSFPPLTPPPLPPWVSSMCAAPAS